MDTTPAGTAMLVDARQARLLRFEHPVERIVASRVAEVLPALQRLETLVNQDNLIAVGFVGYDAAPAFDDALVVTPPGDGWPPLLSFNLYRLDPKSPQSGTSAKPRRQPAAAAAAAAAARAPNGASLPCDAASLRCFQQPWLDDLGAELPRGGNAAENAPLEWTASISESDYRSRIDAVRDHIRRGNSYQVNYTLRLHAPAPRHPETLFRSLIQGQRSAYGAFLREAQGVICSASPELFFRLEGECLSSEPMKGTAPRGLWSEQDRQRALALRRSPKNRAENLMIVDMLRHDMGRIARTGTVQAAPLCLLEDYPTVWQMISRVACRTEAGLVDIFSALFPAASITGAPKARTMRIIRELEPEPRGIYCGAIGYVAPGRRACFSVAIRTVSIDLQRKRATYGVGGGIVWDSRAASEYDECRHKAAILTRPPQPSFSLLETLRWTPTGGFFLLDAHLARLRASARRFGFHVDPSAIRRQLRAATADWPRTARRVRLLVPDHAAPIIETGPLPPVGPPARLVLADRPVDSTDVFLYHKTTRRDLYQRTLAEHSEADDVLLWNSRGEVTESCIANLLVRVQGRWLTPPQRCGLLAGTYRNWLLRKGLIHEGVVRLADLPANPADLRLINGLRRSRRVVWA